MTNNRLVRRKCLFCGDDFYASRSDAKYHSLTCKNRAYRWRKRLPRYQAKASEMLREIETYLVYTDSKPLAAQALFTLKSQVETIIRENNLKGIR